MAWRKESVMKPLTSPGTAPIAAALFVLLAAAGCKKHDADDNAMPPAAASTTAPMPASTMSPGMNEPATPPPSATSASPMGSGMAASNMPADGAAPSGPVSDTTFYADAMKGDQKEINSSQMVEKSGSSADVKKMAKKIESDHTAFDKKVKAAAGSNVPAPSTADTTDSSLAGKTGADLDKAYVDSMVTDHQAAIANFENAASNASTAEAKKLANEALPKLRDHLKMAQDLQQKLASQ
jgi:putative membrane protein